MGTRPARAFLGGLLRAARTGWLIGGVTLLLFFGLEFGYRGARAVRAGLSGPGPVVDSSLHPYAHAPWWKELQRDLTLRRNRFDPYRSYWPLPEFSRYVNIDSLGRRVTPQPPVAGVHRRLFLLGGSALWGFTARDSSTIGAFLAAHLHWRGIHDVEVVNLAQAAFTSTQEAITLLVELVNGRVPDLVVVVNGYNDIASAGKYGEPGHTYGDEAIQQQLDRGRRSLGQQLLGLEEYSVLLQRLQRAVKPPPPARQTPATICGAVAGYYRGVSLVEESLGRAYRFPIVYFLQPHNSVSRKRATQWEAKLPQALLVPPCMISLDSAMADRRGTRFFSLLGLFDGDSATVYIDSHAHITETGNERVAQRIAEVIAPLLAAPR
jgi:lysophospholipase L1-like esterase